MRDVAEVRGSFEALDVIERQSIGSEAIDRRLADALRCGAVGQALQLTVLLRFFIDPATGEPHIAGHDVTEEEVEDVLVKPLEDRPGSEGSRVALGQTEAGRYLKVIYVPDPEPDSVFVITACDLGPKALKALRRRRKRS